VGDRKASHNKAMHPITQWGYISVAYNKFLVVFQNQNSIAQAIDEKHPESTKKPRGV